MDKKEKVIEKAYVTFLNIFVERLTASDKNSTSSEKKKGKRSRRIAEKSMDSQNQKEITF